jgi:hypothetical protein
MYALIRLRWLVVRTLGRLVSIDFMAALVPPSWAVFGTPAGPVDEVPGGPGGAFKFHILRRCDALSKLLTQNIS